MKPAAEKHSSQWTPGQYNIGIWYVAWEGGNWFARAYMDEDQMGKWKFDYRFRYASGPNGEFDDKSDVRSHYTVVTSEISEGAVIKMLEELVASLVKNTNAFEVDFIPIHGNTDKLVQIITSDTAPAWIHVQQLGLEG